MESRRKFLVLAAGSGCLVAGGRLLPGALAGEPVGAADPTAGLQAFSRSSKALGAEISITVLARDQAAADAAITAALAGIEGVEQVMSLYRADSQLCRLNREGRLDDPHPWLVTVLRESQAMSAASEGAFDVTVQPLWALYAASQKQGRVPDDAAVAAVLPLVGWKGLEVTDGEVRLARPGMAVTLNGVAQGFAVDVALKALREHGIHHALVNAGELACLGRKAGGEPWKTGVQHPREADAYAAVVPMDSRPVATSGDYATTFSPDRVHHHIFVPSTGRSPAEPASVTVLAGTGLEADLLSTTLFVAGPERGLALASRRPGTDVLMILKDGRRLKTPGFPEAA